MISINTNLSSMIAQENLHASTNKLNQAIERMSTGYKINHARDNAANYSISTDMTTKMSAYQVAEDNVLKGMDLVATAEGVISQMQEHAKRIRSLVLQVRNNTNGAQSIFVIQQEANARLAEINRLYLSAEYNGISLFSREEYVMPDHLPKAGKNGFIDDTVVLNSPKAGANGFIDESVVLNSPKANADGFIENPKTKSDSYVNALPSIISFTNGANGEYKITSAQDLDYLEEIVESKHWDTSRATFYLANDIDLESLCNAYNGWDGIGNFTGTFDGNGHVIRNLEQTASLSSWGLFGSISNGKVKNLGLENISIDGVDNVGALAGTAASNSYIINCYVVDGTISGRNNVGGLIGEAIGDLYIENCITTCNTSGEAYVGGLVGSASGYIANSFTTGDVSGRDYVGGLAGRVCTSGSIVDCYTSGNISAYCYAGGLVGSFDASCGVIANCYTTGGVVSATGYVGGLVGHFKNFYNSIINSYATGYAHGASGVGGLVGVSEADESSITNCYATANASFCVLASGSNIGGLIGICSASGFSISNSYATGEVESCSGMYTGGLIGNCGAYGTGISITNCYATGKITGTSMYTGGLIGSYCASGIYIPSTGFASITNCYATGNVSGDDYSGGLIGVYGASGVRGASFLSITNCYATGNVLGRNSSGGLIGSCDASSSSGFSIASCYATGNVSGASMYTGGLIGSYDFADSNDFSIINCYATGNVLGRNSSGGLIGSCDASSSSGFLIASCYATGNVAGASTYTGGLIGDYRANDAYASITNCYATGNVSGDSSIGGLIGCYEASGGYGSAGLITTCYAKGDVTGASMYVGGLIGYAPEPASEVSDSYSFGRVTGSDFLGGFVGYASGYITNCHVTDEITATGPNVGTFYAGGGAAITNCSIITKTDVTTSLQVGIHSTNNSMINFDTNFKYDISSIEEDITSDSALNAIDDFIDLLNTKQTSLGVITNRLESTLDEITIQYENLASSRSTIRDVDMAEISSTYIQQQILQQAAATLMTTANQNPSIALQLI